MVHGAAAIAAGRAGVATQGMTLAAGAGSNHLFPAKYGLFAAGRWPLGVVGGKFHLF